MFTYIDNEIYANTIIPINIDIYIHISTYADIYTNTYKHT